MNPTRRNLLIAASSLPVTAHAQGKYPERSIKLIVPYPPGGGVDLTARLLMEPLEKELGQTNIVENKGGAGGLDRRRGDVARRARRLHACRHRRQQHERRPASARRQVAVRSDGLRPHHAAGAHAAHPRGAQRPAGENLAGVHGAGAEDGDPLGLGRHRHQPASVGRAVHPDVGTQDDPRALSRHRSGAERSRWQALSTPISAILPRSASSRAARRAGWP